MLKRVLFLGVAFFACSSSAFALSLTLINESKWEIHELYFSDVDEDEWGPDQLGKEVIGTGESFTLTKIGRGKYDMRIVDEDGDDCTVSDVDFTASESTTITDELLLGCEAATKVEADDEE